MVKLYLNENLSWRIAKALREYGYDVVSSHEVQMDEEDDPTQFPILIRKLRKFLEVMSPTDIMNQIRWLNEFD